MFVGASMATWAQGDDVDHQSQDNDTIVSGQALTGVTISQRAPGVRRLRGVENSTLIGRNELFKAACCNLGESFVTNPSVDVNYSDAATGAKQIRLLGLSGTYVQLLTENIPNFRGAAQPYALGYVPGSWMESIQVSKGASSVKNGYESITGQINIEYLKPESDEGVSANIYGNNMGRLEANADANIHLSEQLCTNILAHFENNWSHHDGNDDGFLDEPRVRQYNFQNRWKWKQGNYMFHGGLSLIKEDRDGGQTNKHQHTDNAMMGDGERYTIGISTNRYQGYMKHAFILNDEHGTNIALMGSATMHEQRADYGHDRYDVNEKNAQAQLMMETSFSPSHQLSAGLSLNYDYQHVYAFQQLSDLSTVTTPLADVSDRRRERETTPGAYLQYTYQPGNWLTVMAGMRLDHSSLYGTFFTPRVHLQYTPVSVISLRLSAGKGYRTSHIWTEYHYLMASSREVKEAEPLRQEEAWNYGASAALTVPIGNKLLKVNAEYYYTHFIEQAVVDYESDHHAIIIGNLDGKSYSHTVQLDASYPFFSGFEATVAWRWNDVRTTYGGRLMRKPLVSRYKGLLSLSYSPLPGLWQFDTTLQLNGSSDMPTAYEMADGTPSWESRSPAFAQLSAQVTRRFRHFSIYFGGENLTNYRQKRPIVDAGRPWGTNFEPTLVWGPVSGAMFYAGIRLNFGKHL